MGLQLSCAKPPWKSSPIQAGALLAGLCIYVHIYIYIYMQPDERLLLGYAGGPPAVPAAGGGAGRGWQGVGPQGVAGCFWQGLLQHSCRGHA